MFLLDSLACLDISFIGVPPAEPLFYGAMARFGSEGHTFSLPNQESIYHKLLKLERGAEMLGGTASALCAEVPTGSAYSILT